MNMTYSYKWFDSKNDLLERTDENGQVAWLPLDPANTDYQRYLEWLAEGNEPLPADEPPAAE